MALVKEVARRRDAGVRLEVAIAAASSRRPEVAPSATSVFAELRRSHPHLAPQRLRKATLLALSWAMEDECCARAQSPWLYGAFQEARFFEQLPAAVEGAGPHRPLRHGLRRLRLPRRSTGSWPWWTFPTMRRCVASGPSSAMAEDHTAVMAAWELPGQDGVPDRDRAFECIWSLEPRVVRDAARVCAQLAALLTGSEEPAELDAPAPGASDDLRDATAMFERLLRYVDRHPR